MNRLSNIERKILTDSKENSEGRIRGRRKTKVSRLKAGSPVSYIEVLVLRRYPPRVVSNRNWTGRVAAACGRDESGVVGLVFGMNKSNRLLQEILFKLQMVGVNKGSEKE